MTRLIIGDIHGCYRELAELLDRAGLSSDDEIIALGDIVDRGPDTPRVLAFFRDQPNARSLLGNHERKHVRWLAGKAKPAASQIIARYQIGEHGYPGAVAVMATFPRYVELPEAILIHGFLEPGVPLAEQEEQTIAGTLTADFRLRKQYDRPWYEAYQGDKPVIMGHLNYLGTGQPLICDDRVFGIDTGCCRGGPLTGILLPGFKIISVPSKRNYWSETLQRYRGILPEEEETERERPALVWGDLPRIEALSDRDPEAANGLSERLAGLKVLARRAEAVVLELCELAARENERILAELRADSAFDGLSAREQGKAYATHTGTTPLARFLHLARKDELRPERIKSMFRTPRQLLEFVERTGVLDLHRTDTPTG